MVRKLLLLTLLLTSAATFADTPGPARSELEGFTRGLENLQMDFTQVVKSQDGRIQDKTHGTAWLQSPDKLRWVYAGEFPEVIVADGNTVWIYDETLAQVTVKPQSNRIADAPLLILTDISQLDQQFFVTDLGSFENLQLLELRSRESESEFDRILMGMNSDGIRLMVLEDAFGQRTEIRFANIARNTDINPELFSFTPPQGADVVGQVPGTDQP